MDVARLAAEARFRPPRRPTRSPRTATGSRLREAEKLRSTTLLRRTGILIEQDPARPPDHRLADGDRLKFAIGRHRLSSSGHNPERSWLVDDFGPGPHQIDDVRDTPGRSRIPGPQP